MNRSRIEYQDLGDVLVFGSNGLLGYAIVDLLQQGYGNPRSISGFDISNNMHKGISFYQGDIRNYDEVIRAVKGKDVVINTVSVVNFNPKNDSWMESINTGGAKIILKACEEVGIKKLIHTSSMDVIYEGSPVSGGDETLPYANKFIDHYSKTKKLAEEHILESDTNLAKCALRATGIYGPRDHVRFPVILKAIKSKKYVTIGNRKSRYSHVYSYNCAYAHILAAQALKKGNNIDGKAHFIVDDSTMNFHDFVDRVLIASGLDIPRKSMSVRMARLIANISEFWVRMPWVPSTVNPLITHLAVATITQDMWFRGDKAEADFGYKPLFTLEEAIKETSAWIKTTYLN